MKFRWVAVVAMTAASGLCSIGTAGANPTPTGKVKPGSTVLGGFVVVSGTGWLADAGNVVSVFLCGNNGLDGTVNCNLSTATAGAVQTRGDFFTGLHIAAPPVPCPCVLRLTGLLSGNEVDVPLIVGGVPTQPPVSHVIVRRAVSITGARIVRRDPLTALFGGEPRRDLVYDVTNTGNVDLHRTNTDIVWGKGSDPTGFVGAPELGDLAVNETKSFRVRVPLSSFSIGSYRAVIRIDPLGPVSSAEASTLAPIPWGLVLISLIGVALLARRLLFGRHRVPVAAGPTEPVAGWYVDPFDPARLRVWDGCTWTNDTRLTEGAGSD